MWRGGDGEAGYVLFRFEKYSDPKFEQMTTNSRNPDFPHTL